MYFEDRRRSCETFWRPYEAFRRLPKTTRNLSKISEDRPNISECFRRSPEYFRRLSEHFRNFRRLSEHFRRLTTISGDLRRSPDIFEAFPSFRRSNAIPSVYLSSKCMVRGFKLSIFSSVLLISNHMIFLVQFGINKHLQIFLKTTNCTRPTGSCNFVSLSKNLLVLIYSKLHSKPCYYLYKSQCPCLVCLLFVLTTCHFLL